MPVDAFAYILLMNRLEAVFWVILIFVLYIRDVRKFELHVKYRERGHIIDWKSLTAGVVDRFTGVFFKETPYWKMIFV